MFLSYFHVIIIIFFLKLHQHFLFQLPWLPLQPTSFLYRTSLNGGAELVLLHLFRQTRTLKLSEARLPGALSWGLRERFLEGRVAALLYLWLPPRSSGMLNADTGLTPSIATAATRRNPAFTRSRSYQVSALSAVTKKECQITYSSLFLIFTIKMLIYWYITNNQKSEIHKCPGWKSSKSS